MSEESEYFSLNLGLGQFDTENYANRKNDYVENDREYKYFKKVQIIFANPFSDPDTIIIHFYNTDIAIVAMPGLLSP